MCGIVGILARGSSVSAEMLERATASLAHRGPDDSGTTIIRELVPEPLEVGLGNRRLAILDLSPFGHQPMRDPVTGNWIVFNGEIYNFREIKARLEKEGTAFAGHSDTEVLLKAYGHWGIACLRELRGMFAFAIWDVSEHTLFLARDPMGVKPLYYSASQNHFLFASEVRTLLQTGLVPRQLDRAGLWNYLTFGSVYDPITMIENVRTLRAGHYLVYKQGELFEGRYWDLVGGDEAECTAQSLANSSRDRNQDQENLGEELREAVRLQLVSDVPVALFLSGGVDSSSLAGILSAQGNKLNTLSIVFREAEFNEGEYSRAIAKHFGTEHHEISISQKDALGALPGAVQAMDQPTIDGVNTFLVSRHTRAAGLKVAISGLGGDEVFGGYSSFRSVPQMERIYNVCNRMPEFARRSLGELFSMLSPANDRNRKVATLVSENGNLMHPYFLARMLFTPRLRNELFSCPDEGKRRASVCLREALGRSAALDPVNRVSYLESRCYMLNTLLRDADSMSMAHGVEVRVPLLDDRLARRILAIPGSRKLDARMPKPLLVGAMGNALPDQIVRRPKRGFTLPFEHWLRGELRPLVEDAMRKIPQGPLGMLLSAASVQSVWNDFLRGRTSWSRPWSLFVLQSWCELHL
jgi:asparagine synthase (glutamine-hydrolysing)